MLDFTVDIPDKSQFKLNEVSSITGVRPYVLRYWEEEFKQIGPINSETGQKVYERKDIEVILCIKKWLFENKMTIDQCKEELKGMDFEERIDFSTELHSDQGIGPESESSVVASAEASDANISLETPIDLSFDPLPLPLSNFENTSSTDVTDSPMAQDAAASGEIPVEFEKLKEAEAITEAEVEKEKVECPPETRELQTETEVRAMEENQGAISETLFETPKFEISHHEFTNDSDSRIDRDLHFHSEELEEETVAAIATAQAQEEESIREMEDRENEESQRVQELPFERIEQKLREESREEEKLQRRYIFRDQLKVRETVLDLMEMISDAQRKYFH